MPPTGKLKPHEIEVFETWVAMGAPYPVDETASAASSSGKTRPPVDIEAGKRHWAFQPLALRSDVPVTDWAHNRLDAFIRSAQQANDERPLAQAAPTQLLRRIKFDLLGLPPTIEELDRFLQDRRPDALARLVDTWLASPRYGERWSRHGWN